MGKVEGLKALRRITGFRELLGILTYAVLGTLSQKTSILISPNVVCSVADI